MMVDGPPCPAFRGWAQTTLSCVVGKDWVVSVREKARFTRQVWSTKMSASELTDEATKGLLSSSKPGYYSDPGINLEDT